jgi:hypothetical protein
VTEILWEIDNGAVTWHLTTWLENLLTAMRKNAVMQSQHRSQLEKPASAVLRQVAVLYQQLPSLVGKPL